MVKGMESQIKGNYDIIWICDKCGKEEHLLSFKSSSSRKIYNPPLIKHCCGKSETIDSIATTVSESGKIEIYL